MSGAHAAQRFGHDVATSSCGALNTAAPIAPPSEGLHVSAGAQVEHAGQRYFDGETPIPQAIGFRPNP